MQNFLTSRETGEKGKNIVGLQRQGNIGEQAASCLLGGGLLLPTAPVGLQHSMLGMRGCTAPGWVKIWNFLCHRHWSCPRSTAQPPSPAWVESSWVSVLLYYQCLLFHSELHQVSVISTEEPPLGLFSPPSSPCLLLFFLAKESMEKASNSFLVIMQEG